MNTVYKSALTLLVVVFSFESVCAGSVIPAPVVKLPNVRICATCNNNPADVALLQKILKDAGYYTGSITGHEGPLTVEAVKKVQRDSGLPETGSTGFNTVNAINDLLVAKAKDATYQAIGFAGYYLDGKKTQDNTNIPVEDRVGVPVNQGVSSKNTSSQSADVLGNFANTKLAEQAKRESLKTTQANNNVTNSDNPNSRQIDTRTGEQAAATYAAAQRTAQEQPASWGRETRANSTGSDEPKYYLPSWFRNLFGLGGSQSAAPVEDRTPTLVQDTRPNPNYSNEGRNHASSNNSSQTTQNNTPYGDPMHTPEPAANNNYGHEGNNAPLPGQNYSHEGNHAGEPAMHTPEPMSPPVTLPTVTVTAPREQQPFNASQFASPVQVPVADLLPNLSSPSDQNYGNEQNHTVQEPTNVSQYDMGSGEGSLGTSRWADFTGSNYSGGGDYSGCFVPGTKIKMGDGSYKNIEDVKIGDTVVTDKGVSVVEWTQNHPYFGYVYGYNHSGVYFFTPDHPFMTNHGWKSIDPLLSKKESNIEDVSMITRDDVLQKFGNSEEKIESIDKKFVISQVYNFSVKNDHTYYANNYLVHNMTSAGGGEFNGVDNNWGQ